MNNALPSVMSHAFSRVPQANIPRSSFDRSHGYKTTFDAGYLVPIYFDEALPGDTHSLRLNVIARLSTPLRPLMDNIFLDTFFFFVPLRLIWTNFVKFMGEQDNPGDSTSFVCPISTSPAGGYAVGSLQDYLGLPTGVAGYTHNVFLTRAYNLIWNSWFRDENLQNSVTVDKGDGPDTVTNYVLLRRGKRHDYFTSCLPWPQKATAVSIPLGTSAPIVSGNSAGQNMGIMQGSPGSTTGPWKMDTSVGGFLTMTGTAAAQSIVADLTAATAATINQLRQAFQIQKLYERDARGGTRYTEIVRSHFQVTSPDARLQRPEYLGGGSKMITVNPVAATGTPNPASVSAGTQYALGTVGAFGVAHITDSGFTKSFTEHGVLLGLAMVRADLSYQQGLDRMYSRSTRFDFFWPSLAQIGEQAVLNKEIYTQGTAGGGADADTFGFQERYAEYRYKPSHITGLFRSTAAGTLDIWHLAQKFTALPTLNATFIAEDPPIDRVIAVPSEPHIVYDSYIQLKSARPMPVFGVPGMIDHF